MISRMHDPASSGDTSSAGRNGDDGTSWRLTWSDEFDGPAGSTPDPGRWSAEIGGEGWGNDEHQYYTDRTVNASLDGDGHLVISAHKESPGLSCWYGDCRYTSARLVTKGRFAQAYGRFESRIKLPRGQGIWPAFWLLGDDIDEVGWPRCGEIDVMEYLGHDEHTVYGALHGPGFDPAVDHTSEESFADGFHTFAVDWSPERVHHLVDGHRFATIDRPAGGQGWAFDHPFFVLLNVAVGGRWPGYPDETTRFPQRMVVDYVRVYARAD
jgi:beta-glucanase (GH16 family)